ncbi:SCAN box domain-containing protein [Trichonephila clavipes]|nr:SCAN box domain-containing protein [Trichonephila clavipes]
MNATLLQQHLRSATATTVSTQTVRNRLHGAGMYARRPMSRFSVHPDNRRIFIWRDRGSKNNPAFVHESVRFGGGGVLVYDGISNDGSTDLYIIRDGPLTARRYRDEILRPIVVPYAAVIGDDIILMDDNCWPHHTNPIEHVWDALGRRVVGRQPPPQTLQELKRALLEEWDRILQLVINSLSDSMPQSESYVEEEVKIILDRVISDRKEQEREERKREREERMAREARQHELELRKLELSQQNQPLNDESGRREGRILAQVPKKDWVAYLLAVLPAELSNMLAREPTERANNYDFVKDLILKRPQCDKRKKNYETVASNETVRNSTDVLAPYTSLGTVNGIEIPILRDTGATLDLICKKYVKPSMIINETVWIRTPLEETAVCLPMAEVELDCVFGHVITKAAVLRDSLDQGKYLLGNKTAALFEEVKKNKEIQVYMVNAVETRSQKKLTEESKQDLNMSEETIPESNEKNKESPDELDDILPLIQPEISELNLIKLSHKDFAKEQMNSTELKTLFEEAKSGSSKKNHYIVENSLLFFQKKDKDGTKRKCLIVPEKYRKNLMTIGHEAAAAHLGVTKTKGAIFKTFY